MKICPDYRRIEYIECCGNKHQIFLCDQKYIKFLIKKSNSTSMKQSKNMYVETLQNVT